MANSIGVTSLRLSALCLNVLWTQEYVLFMVIQGFFLKHEFQFVMTKIKKLYLFAQL